MNQEKIQIKVSIEDSHLRATGLISDVFYVYPNQIFCYEEMEGDISLYEHVRSKRWCVSDIMDGFLYPIVGYTSDAEKVIIFSSPSAHCGDGDVFAVSGYMC